MKISTITTLLVLAASLMAFPGVTANVVSSILQLKSAIVVGAGEVPVPTRS